SLIDALHDGNEGVRAVAAETLGRLADRSALAAVRSATGDESPEVRVAAKKAVAILERVDPNQAPGQIARGGRAQESAAPAHWYVQLSEVVPGKGDAASARKIHEVAARQLGQIAGVTLDAAALGPKERYAVDANITAMAVGKPDRMGRVYTDCGVRMVLATLPEHAIRMMATLESRVEGSNEARDLESARIDCLVDAAKQMSERVAG